MKIRKKLIISFMVVVVMSLVITITPIRTVATSIIEDLCMKQNLENVKMLTAMFSDQHSGEWKVSDGKLFKGSFPINKQDIISSFKEYTDEDDEFTYFAGDTRVLTSLKDTNGKYIVGTPASQTVIDEVLKKGNEFNIVTVLPNGRKYIAAYIPLKNKSGEAVGMFFSGVDYKIVSDVGQQIDIFAIIMALVAIILASIISFFTSKDFVNAIYKASKHLSKISQADLTENIEVKAYKRKDEFGNIFRSIGDMQTSISQIIRNVKTETTNIDNRIEETNTSISSLTSNVEDVSATTQQLSLKMEQAATSTKMMSHTSENIENAVNNIAEKASEGSNKAKEIIERAERLKNNAIISRNTANELSNSVNEKLKGAIEKTYAVKEIKTLSEAILSIAYKTNLLALNASIEAARAGEQGKGFAVVADQIRKLAEDSTSTVTEIQNITKIVLDSVNNLVDSSNEVLEFINTKVIDDYETLVSTGEQYSGDAKEINEMVNGFNKTSDELLDEIKEMVSFIRDISSSSIEAASASENIAEKAELVNEKTDAIYAQSRKIKESIEKLVNDVKVFNV